MITERKTEREFGVYNSMEDKFHNLDYTSIYTNDNEFEEMPSKGFTNEECERFIVHMKDKNKLSIHNIYQPKYLLAFQLDTIRKKSREDAVKEMEQWKNNQNQSYMQNSQEALKLDASKKDFLQNTDIWNETANSEKTQREGKFGEVMSQKPKLKDFGLTLNDFSNEEKRKLLNLNIIE